jgi:hypothetical protein
MQVNQNCFYHNEFIMTVNFFSFLEMFLLNNVDFNMFITLSDADMFTIEIDSFGARRILIDAIPLFIVIFIIYVFISVAPNVWFIV